MKPKQQDEIDRCQAAISRITGFLGNEGFCDPVDAKELLDSLSGIRGDIGGKTSGILFKAGLRSKHLKDVGPRFVELYDSLPDLVHRHNHDLAMRLAPDIGRTVNPVEGRDLDLQQLGAIATDVRTRLIIAGAGTGKTTTIVGLAKHLILSGKASPDEILFLSYTNNSVDDLKHRISKEVGCRTDACTFHRLGMRILAQADGVAPRVSRTDIRGFVKDEITRRMSDRRYLSAVVDHLSRDCRYMGGNREFLSGEEYRRFISENPLITLNGERVKSFGEAEIADHLAMCGIRYRYEDAYTVDTRTEEHGQYHPDFHILDTDVYIEYFGIDREGKVAPFVESDSDDPSTEYRRGMEWKRSLHASNGTAMIELYAYDRSEGRLLERLDEELDRLGIPRREPDPSETYAKLAQGDDRQFDRLVDEISTAISLIKELGGDLERAYPSGGSIQEMMTMRRFRKVLEPVYSSYQQNLRSNGEIDFADMLNLAADAVRSGRYVHRLEYVVVDEYQDISGSRYGLLKALRDSSDFRLFCVGDDWQSIYGFNGSDVGFILDYEGHWGPSETCRIETTYRFSGRLLEESNRFMNRTEGQIRKELRPGIPGDSRLEVIDMPDRDASVREMSRRISGIPADESILILGRFRHDVVSLESCGFGWRPELGNQAYAVTDPRNPGRGIRFMTIHGSKGIQADHVFVLNNVRGPGGFPDRRPESVPIRLLRESAGTGTDEERRLFYVAITRAKKAAYVLTVRGQESEFVKELSAFTDAGGEVCPLCGGSLVPRKGPYGRFMGCSNYRNGCRYVRKI